MINDDMDVGGGIVGLIAVSEEQAEVLCLCAPFLLCNDHSRLACQCGQPVKGAPDLLCFCHFRLCCFISVFKSHQSSESLKMVMLNHAHAFNVLMKRWWCCRMASHAGWPHCEALTCLLKQRGAVGGLGVREMWSSCRCASPQSL